MDNLKITIAPGSVQVALRSNGLHNSEGRDPVAPLNTSTGVEDDGPQE